MGKTLDKNATRMTVATGRKVALRAAVSSLVAVAVPSLLSIVTGDAQFVGATDNAVQDVAVNRYGGYLEHVGMSMALVGATVWLLVFAVTFGNLLLLETQQTRIFKARTWSLIALGVSLLFAFAYWGFVANLHPGLFLATLSLGRRYVIWVQIAYILAPLMAASATLGISSSLAWGSWPWRIVMAIVIAISGGLWWQGVRWAKTADTFPTGYEKQLPLMPATAPNGLNGKPPVSILFIAVDSLRPDHIDAQNTPNLKRLVDQAVYFPNGLVTVPRTGPSWAAELTSMSPIANGVETMFPTSSRGDIAKIALPAELLAKGYRTGVFSEYAGEFFGRIDAGFQVQCIPRVELAEISAQTLLSRAPLVLAQAGMWYAMGAKERRLLPDPIAPLIRGMPNFASSKVLADDLTAMLDMDTKEANEAKPLATTPPPYFALMFYSQPHFPYTSSSPFYKKYRKSGFSPEIAFGRDATNETPVTSDEDKAQLDGLYRASLAESDFQIGLLLQKLRDRHKLDDTIIVLTADHGEGLYECPECVGHGDNLRGMFSLRIPIAFVLPKERFPDVAPHVESAWISQLDVAPTLRSLLGYPRIDIHEGIALIDHSGRMNPIPERAFTAETGEWLWTTNAVPKDRIDYPPITGIATLEKNRIVIDEKFLPTIRAAKHRAVIKYPYKLSYEPSKEAVHIHLYKEDDDPLEHHDLALEKPELTKELKNELFSSILAHPQMLKVGDYFITRPAPPPEEEF